MTDLPNLAGAHAMAAEDALAALDTTPRGLAAAEADARLARHGPNRLPEAPRRPAVLRLLAQFNNVLIYVLLAAAALTATLQHWIDVGVILAVVIANAAIGFIQEGRAEQAMDSIRDMLAPHSAVLRDGRRVTVASSEIVPGDIVLVEPGDRVPADLRLIAARGLRVEEAALTGESVPVDKTPDPTPAGAALGDRTSMLFSGTLIAAGTGQGVVTATGTATEIGRISGLLSEVRTLATPLVEQMDRFARWLTIFILLASGILLLYGFLDEAMAFDDLFMIVVGLAVAAIPEGLPAVLTITLAVGVQAMARRNAIVRRLPAIETLGAVSVICSDKTGTLTRNEMVAAAVALPQGVWTVEGDGYAPDGLLVPPVPGTDPAPLLDIARTAALCNDAHLVHGPAGWQCEGDPMEGALLALAGRITVGGETPFPDWTRTDVIPFDASHRIMAVLAHDHAGRALILVKGAPEAVLALSVEERAPAGGTGPLDPDRWHEAVEDLAARGQRVLAFALREVPQDQTVLNHADLDGRLTFLGLAGLIDPPRAEAIEAVAECRRAGIRVKMITGDHAATARAIGGQIGLDISAPVLTGTDLEEMDDTELADAATRTDIFARTSPEHKLRLVTALQSRGLVVAMTGDGVNDSPALKRADIGIAMGQKGSEAAKEAAEIVLADDNFASIVAAVREGRTVYDNLRKVISWTLPTNAGEAMVIVVALFAGLALPITAVQILWINLVTAVGLGLALAFEPTEPGTMRRPPRPRDAPILSAELVWRIAFVSVMFLIAVYAIFRLALDRGHSETLARTMAMNTFVVLEIVYLFHSRLAHGTSFTWEAARGTRVIWASVLGVTAAQLAVTYFPPLQGVIGTAAVPVEDGVLILGAGVLFFLLIEIEKQMRLAFRPPPDRDGRS